MSGVVSFENTVAADLATGRYEARLKAGRDRVVLLDRSSGTRLASAPGQLHGGSAPAVRNPGGPDAGWTFRDPKVIRDEAHDQWLMVVSGGDHIRFLASTDLLTWTQGSSFGYGDEDMVKWALTLGTGPYAPRTARPPSTSPATGTAPFFVGRGVRRGRPGGGDQPDPPHPRRRRHVLLRRGRHRPHRVAKGAPPGQRLPPGGQGEATPDRPDRRRLPLGPRQADDHPRRPLVDEQRGPRRKLRQGLQRDNNPHGAGPGPHHPGTPGRPPPRHRRRPLPPLARLLRRVFLDGTLIIDVTDTTYTNGHVSLNVFGGRAAYQDTYAREL
ncbi:Levanase [Streptomyces bottropensis ATCC 25435]|uniref:Levanase n=1 Tax=Streptomyces bottropensis ATCC 25435 TaxID=1054862 RepID=M3D9H6_9ACTN|nr:Levanase [Streptomyces bottropensis ATCC 25435]